MTEDGPWLRFVPPPLRRLLAGRLMLQQIAANAGWLMADKVVRLGLGVVVNIWMARYLGPRDFGLFSYAQALIVLFAFVSNLGLPDIVVRDLTRMVDRGRVILASAFVLRAAGALTVVLISIVAGIVLRPHEPTAWLIIALLASSQLAQAMDVIDQRYQTLNRIRIIVILRNAMFVLFSAAKVMAILFHQPLAVFAVLYSAELFVVAGLMFAQARRDALGFSVRDATSTEIRRLLHDTAPLIVRLAAIGIYLRVDQVMIGRMLGDAQVGFYVAATRLTEPGYLIVTAAMTAVVPRLSQMHHFENDVYEDQLVHVIRWLTVGSVAVAVVTTALAPTAIRLLYGARFAPAVPVLMIHAWALMFSTLGQSVSAWFVNKRLIRYGSYQSIAAALVNVAMCLLLIPHLGIAGAAMAAIASQCTAGLLLNAAFKATRPIFHLQLRALGLGRLVPTPGEAAA